MEQKNERINPSSSNKRIDAIANDKSAVVLTTKYMATRNFIEHV
jgi:hypothetical protein